MRLLRHLPIALLVALTAAAPLNPQTPPAYQLQVSALADRLARNIHSAHLKHHQSPRVLVADFTNDETRPNLLGQQIADALSQALQSRLPAGQLIPRKQFQDRLIAAGLTPNDLKNNDALQWHAAQAGANLLFTGQLSAPKDSNTATLQIALTDIAETKDLASTSADISLPPDGAKSLHQPEAWPGLPISQALCANTQNYRKAPGSSPPQCLRCPSPSYSDAARKHKLQATIILRVQINDEGAPTSAVILSGAPYGLNDQAIKAILDWQFRPATKDNQPTASCVPIEVTFRLY